MCFSRDCEELGFVACPNAVYGEQYLTAMKNAWRAFCHITGSLFSRMTLCLFYWHPRSQMIAAQPKIRSSFAWPKTRLDKLGRETLSPTQYALAVLSLWLTWHHPATVPSPSVVSVGRRIYAFVDDGLDWFFISWNKQYDWDVWLSSVPW